MSRAEAAAALTRFEAFLTTWSQLRPATSLAGRKYPARWQSNKTFRLSEIVSIRRHAAGVLQRYSQRPLRVTLDRELQEKIQIIQSDVHAHDLSDVLAIMEGHEIRALVPVASATLIDEVRPLAEAQGFQTKVFPARNIPNAALWP